ncbi:MAG: hypothetical protein OXI41_10395 [Chloroflexota bacterium]|nr:hypothetical protein [Chloroflexota bacterium]MDE2894119.1 hypothetical protein [Chloroflexota bacterium]
MAIFNVRRVRDAFVRAEVTDESKGLELATSLDEELSENVVSQEHLETMEQRVDARFDRVDARFDRVDARFERIDARFENMEARFDARFAQAEADAERRANRHTAIFLTALAVAVSVLGLLYAFL